MSVKEMLKKKQNYDYLNEQRNRRRENRIVLTSFLRENGITSSIKIAEFWNVDASTAKQYLRESHNVTLDEIGRKKVAEFMSSGHTLMDAVALLYNHANTPPKMQIKNWHWWVIALILVIIIVIAMRIIFF